METLQIQEKGSVAIKPVEIDNQLDIDFKPGFYLQTKAFVEGDYGRFCMVEEHVKHVNATYKKIVEE